MRPSKNKHLLPRLSPTPTMNTTRVLYFEYVTCKQSGQSLTKSAMVMLFHFVIYNGDTIVFGLDIYHCYTKVFEHKAYSIYWVVEYHAIVVYMRIINYPMNL